MECSTKCGGKKKKVTHQMNGQLISLLSSEFSLILRRADKLRQSSEEQPMLGRGQQIQVKCATALLKSFAASSEGAQHLARIIYLPLFPSTHTGGCMNIRKLPRGGFA